MKSITTWQKSRLVQDVDARSLALSAAAGARARPSRRLQSRKTQCKVGFAAGVAHSEVTRERSCAEAMHISCAMSCPGIELTGFARGKPETFRLRLRACFLPG